MPGAPHRRASPRWLLPVGVVAIALVGVVVITATAAGQGLDDAAVRHVRLLSEGRFAEARAGLCVSAQPAATEADLRAAVAGQRIEVTQAGSRGTGVDGIPFVTDRGHASIEIAFDGRPEFRRFTMRRERGNWTVCPASAREVLGRGDPDE